MFNSLFHWISAVRTCSLHADTMFGTQLPCKIYMDIAQQRCIGRFSHFVLHLTKFVLLVTYGGIVVLNK